MSRLALVGIITIGALTACGSSAATATPQAASTPTPAPISIGSTSLVTAGTLTIGSDIPYAPQEFYDAQNNPTGFDVEVGTAIAQRLGLKVAFVNEPFTTIIPALNAHRFDIVISAMTITTQRKSQVRFVPYFQAGNTLVVRTAGTFRPTSLNDLCGHHVGVQSSTVEDDELTALKGKCPASAPLVVSEFTTDPEGIEQLTKSKVDCEYTDSPPGGYDVKQSNGALTTSGPIFEVAPEGIAVGNQSPDLQKAVQSAFNSLVADGTYKRLLDKWGLTAGDISKAS